MLEITFTVVGTFVAALFMYVTAVFLLSRVRADNSIMDIAYGPAFALSASVTIWWTDTYSPLPLLITGLMWVWALRLFTRILRKNWGKPEDARYAAWREAWLQRGRRYFLLRSYLQVNLLQGLIILVVASPVLVAIAAGDALNIGFAIVGGLVYALGLGIEATADWQLDRFIARRKSGFEPRPLMTDGLFRYSRRPNYFGESLVWWGLAIMVLPLPYGWIALASPLLITFIVTKVTGPMLEELFLKKHPEAYREYMQKTSYFIPLPPRS